MSMQRIRRRRSTPSSEEPATRELSAGTEPETPASAPSDPSFRDRGRLRRRLRYLRRSRELAYRDLGGLVFDLSRFERDRPDLMQAKVDALKAIDEELRSLEAVLDDRRPIQLLREPGISSCPHCTTVHDSSANYCPHCGLALGKAPQRDATGVPAEPPVATPRAEG